MAGNQVIHTILIALGVAAGLAFLYYIIDLLWIKAPIDQRFCSNCRFRDDAEFDNRLKGEQPMYQHHVRSGCWNLRGRDTSPLTWCRLQNLATAIDAPSCKKWKR